jgi:putative ABC transport system permease protein
MRRLVNKDFINTIYVNAASSAVIGETKLQIEELLRQRHNIRPGQKDNFTVIDLKDVIALREQTTSMIAALGKIAAAVSFTIGGIGILSIMILIVNERRVEIGIRRAVGAGKKDIVLQFLMESSFISFSGGMIGVMAGFIASAVIFIVSDLPFVLSPTGIAVAFLASVIVGVLAGLYPSKKAISIQPADVIRL